MADNPLKDLGVSDEALAAAIAESGAVKAEKLRVAQEMAAYAKSISPVDQGRYAAAWKVSRGKGPEGAVRVINRNFKANWVEDGSAHNPEHAVAARTAAQFGGDAGDVINEP